jgi:hypothetical protein
MEIAKIGELGWLRAAMLTIRDRQMKALDDRALEDFFRRACAFLREFARADIARLDDTRLLAGVKVAYAAARGHGVVGEQGLMRWMCLQIMAGGAFYQSPEFAVLLTKGGSADDLLRELYDRLATLEIRRGNPG